MPKKWIVIIAAAVLAVALVITGLFVFGPKGDKQQDASTQEARKPQILASQTVGSWARDRAKDSKIGPEKSYDELIGSYWNPQAPGNYKGEPGIVYMLDGYYDLTDFALYFANREYFFRLYVSNDCQEFTQIFEVNADNMAEVYDKNYCCRIAGVEAKDIAFIKLVFTGSNSTDNNSYISLRHVQASGTWVKEGPSEIPIAKQEEVQKKSIIAKHLITGSWIRDREGDTAIGPKVSYDSNEYTIWNPQANGKYQGNPGIVYMLNGYYDLTSLQIVMDKREYYMQVYTSSDGLEYTQIADITAENYTQYYDGLICMLKDLTCKDVGYIRLVFTGSNSIDNNTYLSLAEVIPTGTKLDKPAPVDIPDTEPKVGNSIIKTHRVSGSWIRDRADMESLSAGKSYDENAYSYWNPQANGGYAGTPGIVYMLDGYYDVDEIQLIFGTREYFFEVYTSANGYNYTRVAKVNAGNMASYYQDLSVTLTGLQAKNVGYVKVVFTGSNSRDNNTYVSLMEAVVRGTKLDKEAPTTIPNTDVKVAATKIRDHMIVGSWIRDREDTDSLAPYRAYDENLYAGWNPQTNSGYAGKPGVIYRLKNFYDITKFQFNFDRREYFFELYTSVDGSNFDLVANVNKDNMADYYKGFVCTLDELDLKGVGYVKLVFTGSNSADNNTYISLMEVGITGTKLSGEVPGKIPEQTEEEQAKPTIIATHKVTGQWVRDREDTPSLAPNKSYDENIYAGWNPQANSGYAGDPAIVYMLNGYYDISDIRLNFDKREYFFRLYTSSDGVTFNQVAEVTVDNYADYYDGMVASLKDLSAKDVGYVKILFTGSNSGDNNTYISLMEVGITGTKLDKDGPVEIPAEPEVPGDDEGEPKATIVANKVVGSWANDRVGTSIGPERTYDDNLTTNWNPAVTGFTQEAAIVYTLDKAYDLTKLELTFGSRWHYITVSVSANGKDFTEIATINSGNAENFYTDLVCTLAELTAQSVKYVKVAFIGTANNTTWINLMEVKAFGTEAASVPEDPDATEPEETEPEATEPEETEPEETEPETGDDTPQNPAVIVSYEVIGTWVRDREGDSKIGPQQTIDENAASIWNPQATNYKSGEGIIYTLDKAYDLTQILLTFGTRQYYFTLHVSADGETYTQVADVNKENAESYFEDLVCTIDEIDQKEVKYIKILFTGSANGTTYISLADVKVIGKETTPAQ